MFLPWLFFIIEILLFFIIKPYINNIEFYSTVLILFNLPFVFLILARFGKETFLFLFIGLFLRLAFMYWDVLGYDIWLLPHSGKDSVGYYNSALTISQDLLLIKESIYGGLYSKISGVILFLGPSNRIILQYINVLLGMYSILFVYKIILRLKIPFKINRIMLIIMIFFPSSLIFSSILLRENIIAFLVVLSFYFFLNWILLNKVKSVIVSFLLIFLGATFHSGVISIILGYMFMLLFYKPSKNKFRISIQTVFVFFFFLIIFVFLSSIPSEQIPFLDKFTKQLDAKENVYNVASGGSGGSVYLKNLEINNPIKLILFAPIKMLYFIVSPFPLDWRGISDITSFASDSLIYIILFLYPLFNYRKMIKGDPLTICLFIMILSAVFVFGISINNAGTAMRHRYKMFYLIVLLYGLSIKNKKEVYYSSHK